MSHTHVPERFSASASANLRPAFLFEKSDAAIAIERIDAFGHGREHALDRATGFRFVILGALGLNGEVLGLCSNNSRFSIATATTCASCVRTASPVG